MIVHIGSDRAVAQKDILMILNLNASKATQHDAFLAHMRREGRVRPLTEGTPKSAVIVAPRGRKAEKAQAILSLVNTATIVKREAGYAWTEQADD